MNKQVTGASNQLFILGLIWYLPISAISRIAGLPGLAMGLKMACIALFSYIALRNLTKNAFAIIFICLVVLAIWNILLHGIIFGVSLIAIGIFSYASMLVVYGGAGCKSLIDSRLAAQVVLSLFIVLGTALYFGNYDGRIGGDFTNPNLVGGAAAGLLMVILHGNNLGRVMEVMLIVTCLLVMYFSHSRSAVLAASMITMASVILYGIRRYGWALFLTFAVTIYVFAVRGDFIAQQFGGGGRLEIAQKIISSVSSVADRPESGQVTDVSLAKFHPLLGNGFGYSTSGLINLYRKLPGFVGMIDPDGRVARSVGGAENAFVAAYLNGGLLLALVAIFVLFGWMRYWCSSAREMSAAFCFALAILALSISQNIFEAWPTVILILLPLWSGGVHGRE